MKKIIILTTDGVSREDGNVFYANSFLGRQAALFGREGHQRCCPAKLEA